MASDDEIAPMQQYSLSTLTVQNCRAWIEVDDKPVDLFHRTSSKSSSGDSAIAYIVGKENQKFKVKFFDGRTSNPKDTFRLLLEVNGECVQATTRYNHDTLYSASLQSIKRCTMFTKGTTASRFPDLVFGRMENIPSIRLVYRRIKNLKYDERRRLIEYEYIDKEESPLAIYEFRYCSKERLARLDREAVPPTPAKSKSPAPVASTSTSKSREPTGSKKTVNPRRNGAAASTPTTSPSPSASTNHCNAQIAQESSSQASTSAENVVRCRCPSYFTPTTPRPQASTSSRGPTPGPSNSRTMRGSASNEDIKPHIGRDFANEDSDSDDIIIVEKTQLIEDCDREIEGLRIDRRINEIEQAKIKAQRELDRLNSRRWVKKEEEDIKPEIGSKRRMSDGEDRSREPKRMDKGKGKEKEQEVIELGDTDSDSEE